MAESRIIETPGVVRPMLMLAMPVLVEQLLNATVAFVDTWLTGNFIPGESPLAAIGVMAYTMWLFPSFFAAIAIGATALIARAIGGTERRLANRAMHQSFVCGLFLSAITMLLFWSFCDDYLAGMNMKGLTAELGRRYLRWLIPVLPAIMWIRVGIASLRGAGDTVSGFVAMACTNIVNMVVSYSLVTGVGPFPKVGWEGIAIGTAAGYVTGAVVISAWLWRGRALLQFQRGDFRADWSLIKRVLRVGLPGGADVAVILSCHLWFVRIINGLGTLAASAHMLAIRVESLAYFPGIAFQVAASTMTGQYLGANDERRATRGVLVSTAAGCFTLTLAALTFYFGAEAFTAFFTGSRDNPSAVEAVPLLRLAAWAMPAFAVTMVLIGAMRGAGDTRWPLLIALVGFLGVRIPLTIYLAESSLRIPVLQFEIPQGVYGAWHAMVIDIHVRFLLSVARFIHGGWKKAKV